MISVLVCSVDEKGLEALGKNIDATIAVPYELIAIDNSHRGAGICSIYNELATKARFDLLCFLHEDIRMHTQGWGNTILDLFKDPLIGLAGISGTVYKSAFPATWSACLPECYRTNSLQHFSSGDQPTQINSNPSNESVAEVAVIDGVFMATTKTVFAKHQFDESLRGFHGYDLDYSLRVGTDYKVVVSYDILLEHFSAGTLNEAWLQNSLIVHRKWSGKLPKETVVMTDEKRKLNDFIALQSVLQVALKYKGRKVLLMKYYFLLISRYNNLNKFSFTRQVAAYLFK